jgi:single-stranded DNA-specific DHH superfamily exonuclease
MSQQSRYGPTPTGSWKRLKAHEKNGIIGHWEHDGSMSMITLTKGLAHIVHRGSYIVVYTPEEAYGSNPNTIGKLVAKRIGLAEAEDSQAFD